MRKASFWFALAIGIFIANIALAVLYKTVGVPTFGSWNLPWTQTVMVASGKTVRLPKACVVLGIDGNKVWVKDPIMGKIAYR